MQTNKKYLKSLLPRKKIQCHGQTIKAYQEIKQILRRLYTQTFRRPSTLLISIIQPLIWLVMFGALFQNAPIYLFENYKINYKEFLNPGILIFTAFNSSVNAGLNIVFDREFGFLNRILISPISNKICIVNGSIIHIWTITIMQLTGITIITRNIDQNLNLTNLSTSLIIISTVIFSISNISIYSAFILPGHIEFIGITALFLNLPTLFSSTALAPLSFMPNWLQIICCINPLTYAIEIIRNISLNNIFHLQAFIIHKSWIQINGYQSIVILFTTNIISFVLVRNIIQYKYDKN
uniref:ABC transmembrane type-2 domain-containing protein n=1 Tax=Leptosiphonia brodiei TaxID=2608611 RepID=A0A1Z1MA55_9FLOR|nr:hypothetical protein [Leptosiphonia brodiei]ARW62968.1 hypothetical protein [Leptosiphonia brodiei]